MLEVFRSALSTTAMICVPAIPQAEGFSSSIYINGHGLSSTGFAIF